MPKSAQETAYDLYVLKFRIAGTLSLGVAAVGMIGMIYGPASSFSPMYFVGTVLGIVVGVFCFLDS
ncbi:MAG: hypothetical protein Q7S66_04935 [bacterium]|nr:hypothetical protein [bacterium]